MALNAFATHVEQQTLQRLTPDTDHRPTKDRTWTWQQIRLDRGGRVLVWQPPERVAFSFHPGRDAREAQTVEVTFSAAPEGTRVVLLHSGWEKLNANAQEARDSCNRGWEGYSSPASANT